MRCSALSLCLPLLAACPGNDGPATPTTETAGTSTTAIDTTTAVDTTATSATGSTADTTPPSDTDTDTGPIPGCECILDDDPGMDTTNAPSLPTCGEETCPAVSLTCEGACGDEGIPYQLDDLAALECGLTALRDRTPGIVRWSSSENGGQFDETGYVLVGADGTAVRRSWGWQDLTYEVSSAVHGELPPAEHFDACLADPDELARFSCLRGALQSMQDVCDEGWYYTDA